MMRTSLIGIALALAPLTVAAQAGRTRTDNMETVRDAMVAAGRDPELAEIERGAVVMGRGATPSQIAALARSAPEGRTLVVAFDVLGTLTARGMPVSKALAQVQAKLEARASDVAIIRLAGHGGVLAADEVRVGSSATGSVNGVSRGLAVGLTGAATGVVGKR